jgi:ribosomal-protein-alanine N-acetyltransferase
MRDLQTARLRLRPLTVDDADFVLALLNEPSFIEHIGDKRVRTREDARSYVELGPEASYAAHGFGLDCVELKASGRPIGICGLLKRDFLDDVDVGYAFLPEYWSRGYASEAVKAVMADARERLGLNRLAALVNCNNNDSIRLLDKLGFAFEKMVTLQQAEPDVRLYVRRL